MEITHQGHAFFNNAQQKNRENLHYVISHEYMKCSLKPLSCYLITTYSY